MSVSKYSETDDGTTTTSNSNWKNSDVETVVPPSEVLTLIADKDEKEGMHEEAKDKNIVGWDGENDPANPLNWTKRRKWNHVAIVALINFVTPLASSMFTPGVVQVQKEFGNYNRQLSSFVVSVYVLGCEYSMDFQKWRMGADSCSCFWTPRIVSSERDLRSFVYLLWLQHCICMFYLRMCICTQFQQSRCLSIPGRMRRSDSADRWGRNSRRPVHPN